MKLTIIRGAQTLLAEAQRGESLKDALANAGVSISAPCGGRGVCGKCLVRAEGNLSPVTETEQAFIAHDKLNKGWRLACECRAEGDVTVFVDNLPSVIVTDGMTAEVELDPPTKIVHFVCQKPTLDKPTADDRSISAALGIAPEDITMSALRDVTAFIRDADGEYAMMFLNKVMSISFMKPRAIACAVDIGTTTVAAYMLDLETGAQIAVASALNPQRIYGGDVISRVDYADKEMTGLWTLNQMIIGCISELIDEMLGENSPYRNDIRHIVLTGNTVMMHIAACLNVHNIAVMPFVPVYTRGINTSALDVGLDYHNAVVTFAPCVAGYVGADTVTAALACDIENYPGNALMLDIGTNGEIVLKTDKGIFCCAAAAGPAFEGAHIKCGSGAVPGAIDSVHVAPNGFTVTTIGNEKPASICGSGVISAVAALIEAELIDETGYMESDVELAPGVVICARDIREVQLAKAAIAAGILELVDAAGIEICDIDRVFLAGGFGQHIDHTAACAIGLIPVELKDRIVNVGNAAGSGAKAMALNKDALTGADKLRDAMKYIELSACPDFQDRFAECMMFE